MAAPLDPVHRARAGVAAAPRHVALRSRVPRPVRRAGWRALTPFLALVSSVKGVRTILPAVALTFDDGPDPESTAGVLDALLRSHARATFFLLYDRAAESPDLVRRLVAEGHEVALHGLEHDRLTALTPTAALARLREGRDRLARLAGVPITLFRPPHGAQNLGSYLATRGAGLRPIVWSADGGDWENTSVDEVATRVATGARPGGIVVLHDTLVRSDDDAEPPVYNRGEMVATVLAGLEARGFTSLTVSELLTLGRPVRSFWFRP